MKMPINPEDRSSGTSEAAAAGDGDDVPPGSDPASVHEPAADTVLCVGGRSALDDSASLLLTQLLQRKGLGARMISFDTLSVAGISRLDPTGIRMICLSYLDVSSAAHLRFAVRRLRRRVPSGKNAGWLWGQDPAVAEEMAKSAKAEFSATLASECRQSLRRGAHPKPSRRGQSDVGLKPDILQRWTFLQARPRRILTFPRVFIRQQLKSGEWIRTVRSAGRPLSADGSLQARPPFPQDSRHWLRRNANSLGVGVFTTGEIGKGDSRC